MAKDKKAIKYEADISEFKENIKTAEKSIKTLNNELKLNKTQLEGNKESIELLGQKLELLRDKYKKQTEIVENTRKEYEKAIEVYGKDSTEVENLKNKLIQAETKQQSISNTIKETNNQLELQSSKLTTSGDKLERFGETTSKVGDKIEKAGNKLSILSIGVATLGGISLKTSASFETSILKVAATMGITKKEIENGSESYKILEEAAKRCGETTKYSASEAADALNYLALAGYDAKKSAEVLPKVLNLAAAGDLELATASDMVTDAMAALNLETKDLDKYINEMARTSQKSNTNVAQLGEATLTVAGTAKLANMSLETMNAELGILANNGIKGAEGGTHLRNIILSLTSPTDSAATALKNLGINVSDSKGNIRDLNDIMSNFNEKLNELNDEEKTNIISTIFNKTDISAVNALIKGSGDEFANLKKEISNCDNTAQDMADTMNSGLEGEMTLLKSQTESIVITMGRKLMPTAKKVVGKISDLATSFSELTDEQVESIVKTGAFVVALGPVVKIGGKAISTIGNGVKSIDTLSKAIGVLKTDTKSGIKEVDNLAKTISNLKSPAGIATIGITALAGALVYLAINQSEATKETIEFAEKMAEQRKEYEEYNQSIDETTNANLAQIDSVSKLKDELVTLVDENGNVKQEYESRVDFILNQLNKALGTEYKLNGNVIESYKQLQDEIDTTIEKKRAEIILNSKEQKYQKAIETEEEAVENLKNAHDNLGMSIEEARKKHDKLKDQMEQFEKNGKVLDENGNVVKDFSYINTGKELKNLKNLIQSYENAEDVVKQCTENKKDYENSYALWVEEKYDEIGNTVVDTTKNWTDSSIKEIQQSIEKEKNNLDTYKKMYEETGNEVALQKQKQAEQNLRNLTNELISRTTTIEDLGEEEISAWKTLANNSYEEYKNAVAKMPLEMQQKIQEATEVIVEGTPYATEVTQNYVNSIISSLEQDERFRQTAINSLYTYMLGLSDEEQRNLIKKAGIENVDEIVEGLKQGKKLSEEQGIEILKALATGLKNPGEINSISNQAKFLATKIAGAFSMNVVANTSNLPGHKNGLDYVPYDNYVARLHEGERVLTKEENREYMNENISNKVMTNNNNIVMQFYPQTMSEAEMERAFAYTEKKYGKLY